MRLLAAPLALSLVAAASPDVSGSFATIRPDALRAHVRFLASDLLEGRGTGTRGYDLAASYVASQFEAVGLEPGAADGSWRQSVAYRRGVPDPEHCRAVLMRGGAQLSLAPGDDFACWGDPARASGTASAAIVFAGYGVSAPERGYDDYAGIEVRGKIVILVSGAPPTFPPDERAFYGARVAKREDAARRGAVAVIGLVPPDERGRLPWAREIVYSRHGTTGWLDASNQPFGFAGSLQALISLSPRGATRLFEDSPRPMDEVLKSIASGRPASFELGSAARIDVGSRHEDFKSDNVIGVLRGSDPGLGAEAVVLSAHLDHLGIEAEGGADRINNGAYDNASGVANLIETARAASSAKRPARSVLFVALAGEEMGLLGSDYFARHPPLRPVADVNLDMALTLYPISDMIAFGAEHSTLGRVVEKAAKQAGLSLSPNPFPQEGLFVRSDHYSFVKQGVPAVMLSTGLRSADPGIDGAARYVAWLRNTYHTPADDMDQLFDWESAAKVARLNLMIAMSVANAREVPRFNSGDFFGQKSQK
jgi:Peptidase family M28